jgi:cell pole-organizing protein PopZ
MSEAKPGVPDPSMEDILASIRKILNEDEQPPSLGATEPLADGPVLLTTDMMITPPSTALLTAPPAEPPPQPNPAEPDALPMAQAPVPIVAPAEEGLVAPAAAAAAMAAIGQLTRAVAQDRGAGVSRSGLSIEDVVREELRPLLKEWLDTHLPAITERVVRSEIERLMARQG